MRLHKALALPLCIAAPIAALANFQNGSFENPTLVNGEIAFFTGSELPAWTISGPFESCVLTNGYTVGSGVDWNPTPDGNQYLYINSDTEGGQMASQAVDLNSGENLLTFIQADFATTYVYPGGEVDVSVYAPDNSLVVDELFTTPDFSPFISQSLSFDASAAGMYTFDFTGVTGHAAIIDGVSVSSVPGPGAAVTASAFIGLAIRKRRNTKRS